jgi:hypothetical protein
MHPTADKTISDLTFDIYVFTEAPTAFLLLYFNITLDVDPTERMIYGILVDREPEQSHWLLPEVTKAGELPDGWFSAVQDCVWLRKHVLPGGYFRPGRHSIPLWLSHSNMILEKLVVDLGGTKESYLGPPPSFCIQNI